MVILPTAIAFLMLDISLQVVPPPPKGKTFMLQNTKKQYKLDIFYLKVGGFLFFETGSHYHLVALASLQLTM